MIFANDVARGCAAPVRPDRRTIVALSIGLAFLASAGCTTPSTKIVYPCPALALGGPPLVYPIANATGVPTSAGSLVFAGRIDGATAALVPIAASGIPSSAPLPPPIQLGTFTSPPSPLPSPRATGFDAATLSAIAYPTLRSATTYAIRFDVSPNASGCAFPISSSGTFTTQ